MEKLREFIKKESITIIAWVLAIISSFFVPISKEYLNYIHWDTVSLIIVLQITMNGLKRTGLIKSLGEKLLQKTRSMRGLELVLVLSTFFSAMIVTNDVALLTFVPFTILTLDMADKEAHTLFTVALLPIAANLGSMISPIGNPHNIFFYFLSGYTAMEFIKITAPYVVLGFFIIILILFIKRNESIENISSNSDANFGSKIIYYIFLFALVLFSLTKIIKIVYIAIAVLVVTFFIDRDNLQSVDYSLICTFIGFFIFVGNLSQIEYIKEIFPSLLEGREFLVSILSSQIMCNIPTSILLGQFSTNYPVLIVATDIGGLGTIIASMANLIAFQGYTDVYPKRKGKFLITFSLLSLVFLILESLLFQIMHG